MSKKTQNSLGKIIKRPPLTDKLLAKPPFRFLHDIVTSVINTTGFMQGLYSTEEQNSDHVKDKESKIAFLQKALDMVSLVTGKKIPMKPVKVVSGHEPEKTNEFLQMLAEAINKQVDNDSYVQRVLSSRETNKSHVDPNKEKDRTRDKSSSRRSEKERSREKSDRKESSKSQPERHKENENDPGEKEKQRDRAEEKERRHRKNEEKEKAKERSHRSRTEEKGEKERDPEKEREREKRKNEERSKEKRPSDADRSSRKARKDDTKENEKPSAEKKELDDKMEDPTPRRLPRPTSAKGSRQKREENEASPAPATTPAFDESPKQPVEEPPSQPPKPVPTARPSSARPAPPKQRKPEVITTDPIIQLGSGRPTNVITDDAQESDEDEQFIVEDNTPLQVTKSVMTKETDVDDETEHGGLVKKILETTKELEGTQENNKTAKTQIDNSSMTNVAYQKQRHLVVQKIEKLQESIQTLTKSANPLGKIMDYIQEDLDSMQKELQRWKQERIQHTMALRHEKEITERTVEPLKMQLASLEQAIRDQVDIIATVKANVIRNDRRIVSLLHSVAKV